MLRGCRECLVRYSSQPGTGRCLGHIDGLRLFEARCGLDGTGFTRPAVERQHRLVLPRSGAYLLRVNGRQSFVDTGAAVITRPGDELSVAHPLGCGDTFTAVELEPELDRWPASVHRLPLDDVADLQHRLLIASCRRGADRLAVAEQVFAIVARLEASSLPSGVPSSGAVRPGTAAVHRRLVAETQEVLAGGLFTYGLKEIAAEVNASPHHLSRIFRRVTGETLTGYRNRMRVRAVLADVQDGADCLRTLAARYGFADQAHLTRLMRRQVGLPPSAVKRLLAVETRMNIQRRCD